MNDYDRFTEEMVRYFIEHKEYHEDLIYLKEHPRKHRKFVLSLFQLWKINPDQTNWNVAHLIGEIRRG